MKNYKAIHGASNLLRSMSLNRDSMSPASKRSQTHMLVRSRSESPDGTLPKMTSTPLRFDSRKTKKKRGICPHSIRHRALRSITVAIVTVTVSINNYNSEQLQLHSVNRYTYYRTMIKYKIRKLLNSRLVGKRQSYIEYFSEVHRSRNDSPA